MRFKDRLGAARMLIQVLKKYRGTHPLMLVVPEDVVPMDILIASALDDQLNMVLVYKLGTSFNPELAVGSMEGGGWSYIAPYAGRIGAGTIYLEQESAEQMEVI